MAVRRSLKAEARVNLKESRGAITNSYSANQSETGSFSGPGPHSITIFPVIPTIEFSDGRSSINGSLGLNSVIVCAASRTSGPLLAGRNRTKTSNPSGLISCKAAPTVMRHASSLPIVTQPITTFANASTTSPNRVENSKLKVRHPTDSLPFGFAKLAGGSTVKGVSSVKKTQRVHPYPMPELPRGESLTDQDHGRFHNKLPSSPGPPHGSSGFNRANRGPVPPCLRNAAPHRGPAPQPRRSGR